MDKMINSELVRELRTQKSWSQEQLATVAGISPRTVQRIENEGTCSLESLKALASVFDTSVVTLEINKDALLAAEVNRKGLKYG